MSTVETAFGVLFSLDDHFFVDIFIITQF